MSRILSIVWYKIFPPVFGGQKGIAGFNQELSQHHELVCLCSNHNEAGSNIPYKVIPELPADQLQFIDPRVWSNIRSVTKQVAPEFIILEHPYHGIAAVKTAQAVAAKLIVHSHNIESERFRELGKWGWQVLRRYEKWVHRKAAINVFKTRADLEFAISQFGLDPLKCVVVPYGIERPFINPDAGTLIRERHGIGKEEKILLFAGTLDYKPNALAFENIFTKIAPLLEKQSFAARVIICGRNHKPSFKYLNQFSHPSVIVAGEVTDIENYFQAADAFINPVQTGGGIQTKNIEALSHHCNVVCFANKISDMPPDLCANKLWVAEENNWPAFITATLAALGHKEKTPETFFTYFGWENCIRPLLDKIKM
jgi:glycosyltransferase involved in cell wall biosynthesis